LVLAKSIWLLELLTINAACWSEFSNVSISAFPMGANWRFNNVLNCDTLFIVLRDSQVCFIYMIT